MEMIMFIIDGKHRLDVVGRPKFERLETVPQKDDYINIDGGSRRVTCREFRIKDGYIAIWLGDIIPENNM